MRPHHAGHPRQTRLQHRQCRQPGPALWRDRGHRLTKWKKRTRFQDCSHTAHRLQTTLTPAQERVVVELRRTLLLPLDDLLAVTREFICAKATRSGLDRCLRRHAVGNLNALKPATPREAHKSLRGLRAGLSAHGCQILGQQMADESQRRYLFVAIDRATRCRGVAVKKNKTAACARSFLNALHKACPLKIHKLLTDNGKEFTDRLFASRARQPTGLHEFDQLCQALGIEHRLTKPRTPRTLWHGRTLQWPYCGCAQDASLSRWAGSGADLDALRRFVQPPVTPVGLEKQNPDADHERLVRFPS